MSDKSFLGYGNYTFDEFKFENGEVLKNVNVEYYITGTPKYNDEGNIINAIVHCHNFTGSCYSINELYQYTSVSGPFDKNEYCFICISALGFPESCSPSTTGLNFKFPKYSVLDVVNFNRQFLKEFLNINHVLGISGSGLGGYTVYSWACEYPDEMDFIIVHNSSYLTNGNRYVISKAVDSIIISSDDFYSETYEVSLSKTLISVYRFLYSFYFSRNVVQEMSRDEIDILMDDFVENALYADIYDIKYVNDLVRDFDVGDKLGNIKSKALIIGCEGDVYYSPENDVLPLKKLIKNSEVVLYKSNSADYHDDYPIVASYLKEFLKNLKK